MILLLHNRYRTPGGEERVVRDLARLIGERLGEEAYVLERDSSSLSGARAAHGLLRGGLEPHQVADAVRRTGARVVHAHNLLPAYGWRALEAARDAGARTVLTLHQYRLVCAAGTCVDPAGADCTRCHGRDTRPGVRLNCRGGPRAEAVVYAAALARWSRRLVRSADALTVPSAFALARLRSLGAPLGAREASVVPHPVEQVAAEVRARPADGGYALFAGRLARDKGPDLAIAACAGERIPLVVAGDGPLSGELRALAARLGGEVTFTGRVDAAELARLRAGAALAIVPSRLAETFGLSCAEAMAAGLPVAATRAGALTELLPESDLVPREDPAALGALARRLWRDAAAGERNAAAIERLAAPAAVARALAAIYDGA